jgi:hypothetical protein
LLDEQAVLVPPVRGAVHDCEWLETRQTALRMATRNVLAVTIDRKRCGRRDPAPRDRLEGGEADPGAAGD